jgi:undecaprenyl-diphosphatase
VDGAGDVSVGAAVLLGIVEGLTEWLPVSSTGHLMVVQRLLGISGGAADTYAIAIQAGAIVAVAWLYPARLVGMARGALGRDPPGRRLAVAVIVAAAPAAVVGLAFEDVIMGRLFGPWPVVVAWCTGGLVILVVVRHRRHLPQDAGAPLTALGWRGALLIGCAQTLALWPGVSRSLVTILAATMLGLTVPAAVEFSFLLGFVTLGGATLYAIVSGGGAVVAAFGLATPLLGLVVAFAASAAAMRWMVAYVSRHGLEVFGWYRILIAAVIAVLLTAGWL